MLLVRALMVALAVFPFLGNCIFSCPPNIDSDFTTSASHLLQPSSGLVYTVQACRSEAVEISDGGEPPTPIANCYKGTAEQVAAGKVNQGDCSQSTSSCPTARFEVTTQALFLLVQVTKAANEADYNLKITCEDVTTITVTTTVTTVTTTATTVTTTATSVTTTTTTTTTATLTTVTATPTTITATIVTATATGVTTTTSVTTTTIVTATATSVTATTMTVTATPATVTATSTNVTSTSTGTDGNNPTDESPPTANDLGGCMTLTWSGANLRALIAAYRKTIARAANVNESQVEVTATPGARCASLRARRLQENLGQQVAMVFVIRYPPSMEQAVAQTQNTLAAIPPAEVARILAEEVSQEGLGQVSVITDLVTGSVETIAVTLVTNTAQEGDGGKLFVAIFSAVLAVFGLYVGIYLWDKKRKAAPEAVRTEGQFDDDTWSSFSV